MRRQYAPGMVLLVAAPLLIGAIGHAYGWIFAVVALMAFLSMFRRPLMYFARKGLGLPSEGTRDDAERDLS